MNTTPAGNELEIKPLSTAYDPSDARWLGQVQQLLAGLQANVGPVRKLVTPVEGQKGGIEQIIIALGSAGAITAAVEVFRAWLGRDKTREVEITTVVNGRKKTIKVRGDNISNQLLSEALQKTSL